MRRYHLAKEGAKNVVLLEKSQLTHGCTWHAAGLLGQLRGTKNLTRMLQASAECFGQLQADTGLDPEWRPVGSIRVASSTERWKEIRRSASQAASFGFGMELISPAEAQKLCPVLETSDLLGAAWIPTDGHVEPTSLTNAFAAGARARGVKILQGVEVVGMAQSRPDGNLFVKPRVKSLTVKVKGAAGTQQIEVGQVVNCAGLWARKLGKLLGMSVPTINVEHQYLVTERIAGKEALPASLPSFRDPDRLLYYKPEQGGLVIGGWEHNTVPRIVPDNFGPELYEGNMDRFEPHALNAAHRTPVVERVGVRKLVNGPIPISPDGEPIMGLSPEFSNVFVAAGFTAGIGASGGAGRFMSEWILGGEPSIDLFPLDIRRFASSSASAGVQHTRAWLDIKGVEAYGNYYKLHYPNKESSAGRDLRRSGCYAETKALGAVFGSKMGWERPLYFAVDAQGKPLAAHRMSPSFNRRQDSATHPDWELVRQEHEAARKGAVLIDQSSFAKLQISGRDAPAFMSRLANNDVSGPVGSVVYTQLLNERGGIEADVTIARTGELEFYLITGSGFATRDFGWIRSQLPLSSDVQLVDVTTKVGVINVAGPNSRKLLQALGVDENIDNEAFPFMSSQLLQFSNGVTARALRVTFIGELGFELHVGTEQCGQLYAALWAAAQAHPDLGVRNAGYRVLETLRLEKGYRVWGSDLSPQVSPLEAGLAFCCKWGKPGGFIGEEALKSIKDGSGPTRKLVCFTVEDGTALSNEALGFVDAAADAALALSPQDPLHLYGNEAISYRGRVVGYSTSAGFGYTVGKDIVYGFLPSELADLKQANDNEGFTLNAYAKQVPLKKQPNNKALYDHKRERILI